MDWINSSVLVAVVSSILTGGLAMLGAWFQMRRLGVNEGNIAEIADRAALRLFTMEQLKHLTARVDECEADRTQLHFDNVRLTARILELERSVNGH